MLQIALIAENGNYLVAEGGGGREVLANRDGIGPWETFRLFNRSGPEEEIQHGSSIVLQAWNGRFVSATGGGPVIAALEWIEASTTFTIEKVHGAGAIVSGEQVALKSPRGSYVVAEDGGGGVVNANRPRRDRWETFTIRIFRPQLIRLRSADGRYVTAEGGGGAQVTANRERIGLWETFSLLNLSRPERSIRVGDSVALRSWNGQFMRVVSYTSVDVRANRATSDAVFRVGSSGGETVEHGQQVRLESLATSRFLAARAGVLVTGRSSAVLEAQFTIEIAERNGIGFEWLPNGSALPGRPFGLTPDLRSGEGNLLLLHFSDDSTPPLTTSNDQLRDAVFGAPLSLASWLHAMAGGVFQVRNSGVYGPIHVRTGAGHNELLTAAEDAGVPLSSFAHDGVIDSNRTAIVHVFGTGPGGQVHSADAVSRRGVRYIGQDAGVGVTPDVDERSRMVLCHELSHLLLDVVDRYGYRRPLRGDVIANRAEVGEWERFVIERIDGPGPVSGGDRFMLRAHDGRHVSVDPNPPNFVNTEAPVAGDARIFTLANLSGGDITSGARVALRAKSGSYVTALLGGNSALTANAPWMREWEWFRIRKLPGSSRGTRISSGDTISLESSGGFFVVAETDARDRAISTDDRRRGYRWDGYPGGGQGGQFDNADANYTAVMLSLYDRLRFGWARPLYLTPDNRGCFVLRPFLEHREALILFDPQNPQEWYTVENRQYRENVDEVPSSGVVIAWVRQDTGYWQWWLNRSNDSWPVSSADNFYPAIISAAAPTAPPNLFARPPVLYPELQTKRSDPRAAFTDQEIVLPLGNGDPSRFHLSFHPMTGGSIVICIR